MQWLPQNGKESLESRAGIARGWFLLAAGAVIIVILTIVLFSVEDPKDSTAEVQNASSTSNNVAENSSADSEISSLDTSTWKTYENTEFNFTIEYPQNWVARAGTKALDPLITIYQPPIPNGSTPPFVHFDDATHVSIYPHGISTEGIFGRTAPTSVSVSPQVDSGRDFVLENDEPWATMLSFSNPPNSWGPSGFVWARVRVADLVTSCTRANREISMNECDPLVMEDKIRRDGSIDKSARQIEEEMLASFRFTGTGSVQDSSPQLQ